MTEAQQKALDADENIYLDMVMKPRFTRAPITEAGRVAFLGESSNLTLLVHDRMGMSDVVHYPLPENVRGSRARLTELGQRRRSTSSTSAAPSSCRPDAVRRADRGLLQVGAPDHARHQPHPVHEAVSRPEEPAVAAAAAGRPAGRVAVCNNAQLMDANGSTTPAALTFYKRAKALYDANYEDDRVTIVQALLLMGWYWEGPEDVTKNVFYWSPRRHHRRAGLGHAPERRGVAAEQDRQEAMEADMVDALHP